MSIPITSFPAQATLTATDVMHLRSAANFDYKITGANLRTNLLDSPLETLNIADINIGGHPAPTYELEIYDATGSPWGHIQSGIAASAGLRIENTARLWLIEVEAGGDFQLRTAGGTPFIIDLAAPTNSLYINASGNIGFGIAVPLGSLHIDRAANPSIRLSETAFPTEYLNIYKGTGQFIFNGHTSIGHTALIDINPIPADGVSSGQIRLFRSTVTTGDVRLILYKGDGTAYVHAIIGVNGADSRFQIGGGSVTLYIATVMHPTLDTLEVLNIWSLIGRDNNNNSVAKTTIFGGSHYTNAEEPVEGIMVQSAATANVVFIGGGYVGGNAATRISFYTGGTITTLTGTERAQIDSSGYFLIKRTAALGTHALQINGDLSLRRDVNANAQIDFASDAFLTWSEASDRFETSKALARTAEDDSTKTLVKHIQIGNWNMDTTAGLLVNHGLPTTSYIRNIWVLILPDAGPLGTMVYPLMRATLGTPDGWIAYVSPTQIELQRLTGGWFDSANFNDSPFNRGFIFIEYRVT